MSKKLILPDSQSILNEILADHPHLSGISTNIKDLQVPYVPGSAPVCPCITSIIKEDEVREISFDINGEKIPVCIEIEVLMRAGAGRLELHVANGVPMLFSGGVEKLAKDISFLFSHMGFDLTKMTSIEDIMFIARPFNGDDFITWSNDVFLDTEETRLVSMIAINTLMLHAVNEVDFSSTSLPVGSSII